MDMKSDKKGLSMRKEPNQDRAIDTMDSILKATAHILEKEGFEKTSTNKIAAKAGVSIGSLYQYFPTKDSILALLMDRYLKTELEMLNRVLQEKESRNLKETINALMTAILHSKKNSKRFTKIFAQKLFGFNKLDALKKIDDHMLELFKSHIKPFEAEIRTENLEMALWMSIQCVKVIPVSIMFHDNYELEDPKVQDELVHLIYQYLKK
jgi:AcrR family transcriptional regulator